MMTDVQEVDFVGVDGWRFHGPSSQRVIELCQRPERFHGKQISEWLGCLRSRRERFAASSIPYIHAFLPTRIGVFPEYFPLSLRYPERSPAALVAIDAAPSGFPHILDFGTLFRESADRAEYGCPDSLEWTQAALTAIGDQMVRDVVEQIFLHRSPIGHPGLAEVVASRGLDEISDALQQAGPARETGLNSIATTSRHALAKGGLWRGAEIRLASSRPAVLPGTLVVFGSAMLASGDPSPLLILSRLFTETAFLCTTSVDFSYAARNDAAFVLTAITEDLIGEVPGDDYDIGVDQYFCPIHYPHARR